MPEVFLDTKVCARLWGLPTHHCAGEGGALPLGLEQVNGEMSRNAPIV